MLILSESGRIEKCLRRSPKLTTQMLWNSLWLLELAVALLLGLWPRCGACSGLCAGGRSEHDIEARRASFKRYRPAPLAKFDVRPMGRLWFASAAFGAGRSFAQEYVD